MSERPTTGSIEERTAAIQVADKRIRGLIPFNVESRDLGGWTEIIEPTAFRNTNLSELRAVIDHAGVPLGRYPGTLDVEDRSDGLHWSLDPPKCRQDVVEAIERGDMRAGSWRMRVARDEWRGDVRHVHEIRELRDVTIVGAEEPAYGDAAIVEYRTSTGGKRRQEGAEMALQETGAETAEKNEHNDNNDDTEQRIEADEKAEQRSESAGSLHVEQRATTSPRRGLADEFRSAGFPGETAEIPWQTFEDRAVTWSPSINLLNQVDRQGGAFPSDMRYIWPVLERVAVDSAATSVQVLVQLSESVATGASVIRDINAVTPKAEVNSTVSLQTVPLKGVAAVESGIPNIVLEQPAINSIIEGSLRRAANEGLDRLVADSLVPSGFLPPGTDNPLVSYRKAMTALLGLGFNPDVLVLTPQASEDIDVMVSGAAGATADFVFTAGAFGPDRIFGMRRVVSKVVAAPVVLDAKAFGKLYASPARLSVHEMDFGRSNSSLVRLELSACVGVERQQAAVRIASS